MNLGVEACTAHLPGITWPAVEEPKNAHVIKVIVFRRVVRLAFAAPALVTPAFRFICMYA